MNIMGGISSPRNSCTPRDGRSDNYHEVKDSHLRMSKRQRESRTFLFLWLAVFSHSDKNIYWSLMMFEGRLPWVFNLSPDFAVAKSVKEKNLRKTEKHVSKMIQRVFLMAFCMSLLLWSLFTFETPNSTEIRWTKSLPLLATRLLLSGFGRGWRWTRNYWSPSPSTNTWRFRFPPNPMLKCSDLAPTL